MLSLINLTFQLKGECYLHGLASQAISWAIRFSSSLSRRAPLPSYFARPLCTWIFISYFILNFQKIRNNRNKFYVMKNVREGRNIYSLFIRYLVYFVRKGHNYWYLYSLMNYGIVGKVACFYDLYTKNGSNWQSPVSSFFPIYKKSLLEFYVYLTEYKCIKEIG